MEPEEGVEPSTYPLRRDCSTTELLWPLKIYVKKVSLFNGAGDGTRSQVQHFVIHFVHNKM
jgi:hypothetical protein